MTETRERIARAAKSHATRPALIDPERTLTWHQLATIARAESSRLRATRGYTLGNIALCGTAGYAYVVALMATFDLGVRAVLLDPRHPVAWLQQQIDLLQCQLYLKLGVAPNLEDINPASIDFRPAARPEPATEAEDSSIFNNRLSTVTFTSGSSGEPRPILHLLRHHYYSATGSNANLSFAPGDRWLLSLPLHHVGGLSIIFRCLFGGGAMVMPDNTTNLATQIVRDRITHLSLVPTQLQRLLQDESIDKLAPLLKVILIGGSPIPEPLMDTAREAGLNVYPTYGSTEMASQIATAGPGHENCLKTLTYRELKIADDNEILVRGRTLGWGRQPDGSWSLLTEPCGWWPTGDIGNLDEHGCLTVTGRNDNMFVSGGENVHAEQVESALTALDTVERALVVPIEDAEFGHRPVAFVKVLASEPPLTEASPRSFLEEKLRSDLPGYMMPVAFFAWPEDYVDAGLKPDRVWFRNLAARLLKV